MSAPVPAVSMRHVTRTFGPVVANDDVSLDLIAGEIHGLVGENGAGKSTLMRILYGLIQPDAGTLSVAGRAARIPSPAAAMRLGLGMVHQHFMLVGPLTVAENVTLGREPAGALGTFDRGRAERAVADLAARHGLPVDPRARIEALSVGAQQRVEILKALYRGARVLILDEPTAVLTPQEVDDLFRVLRELQAGGVSIVLITHKLAEVRALAQRVTVMRAGRVVGGGPIADFPVERMAEMMVGHAIPPLHERAPVREQMPLLGVCLLDVLDDRGLQAVRRISFEVHAGEIVGIAGVEGNGQHELIECLAGLRAAQHGEIRLQDRDVTALGARGRTQAGLAHIPSDRLRRGLVPAMTVAENLVLGRQREPLQGVGPLLPRHRLDALAEPLLERYDVRPPAPRALARQLSGGNQQKLIAARELSRGAPVVLAAHPTRGVDLGAIAFLHQRLLAERDAGRAVLLVSSELSEILALSDRIFVMYEGRLVHETRPDETDERTLGLHMTGRGGGAGPAS
jgi:general nucleoside transport system ATP-binding protein